MSLVSTAGCAQVLAPVDDAGPAVAAQGASDAGNAGDAAGAGDAGASDARLPGAPARAVEPACAPCVYDLECGPGGACVVTDPVRAPGVRGCAPACSTRGAACDAGGEGGTCQDGPGGTLVCFPAGGCLRSERGAACASAGECSGRYGVCAAGQCLAACVRDSDCEAGYTHCAEAALPDGSRGSLCVPDAPVGPQACGAAGANDAGVGAGCASDAECGAGLACVGRAGDGDAARGFCSRACAGDAECGAAARCRTLEGDGSVCVPDDCACRAGGADTALDRALAAAGLSRCELGFDRHALAMFPPEVAQNRYRLPGFDRAQRDWLSGARFARETGPALDARAGSLAGLIAAAAGLRDAGDAAAVAPRGAMEAPEGDAPLADEVARLIESQGGRADRAGLARDAQGVPAALQRAVARVLRAVTETARARDAGLLFARTPAEAQALYVAAPHMLLGAYAPSLSPSRPLELGAMLGDVVLPVAEATALAATVEGTDWSPFRGMRGVHFRARTPLGDVVIGDGGDDEYPAGDYPATALLVELGGDDAYTAPVGANASAANSVSVLIDLGGDDTYGYAAHPVALDAGGFLPSDGAGRYAEGGGAFSLSDVNRQGAGRLGVGMLFDLGGGRDRYRSLRGSQGFGALGIGALADDGGDDAYELEAGGQGAGMFGLGVLLDRSGDDTYTTWYASQGFGWVRGAGLLYDAGGADHFVARTTPVAYPAAQDPRVNASVSQGMGFGRNGAGYVDGTDMFGGVGLLRDADGADQYECGVFCQGAGYLGGMGLLLDRAGDDQYDGRWYVQGAAAHHGYAALVDGGGRDAHNTSAAEENVAGGAAHDFSLAFLLADGAEGDDYAMPNLSLGAGNANGAGFFADAGGDDAYRVQSPLSCGNAAVDDAGEAARRERRTVGVFLDAQGRDRYERRGASGGAGNDARWVQREDPGLTTEVGAGCDGDDVPAGI